MSHFNFALNAPVSARRNLRLPASLIGAFLLLLLAGGCSRKPYEVAKVTGVVIYNGKPIEGATVMFHKDGAPLVATGKTNAEGQFTLSSLAPDDGAVVGLNQVSVRKQKPLTDDMVQQDMVAVLSKIEDPEEKRKKGGEMMADRMARANATVRMIDKLQELPLKYRDPKTSGLTFEVKNDGDNMAQLVLTD